MAKFIILPRQTLNTFVLECREFHIVTCARKLVKAVIFTFQEKKGSAFIFVILNKTFFFYSVC